MMDNKEILEKNGGKRFDCVLMNPPYDRSLHLKFLEKVIEIGDKVVSIQPINWLQKAALFGKIQNNIYCDKLEIIKVEDSVKYFNDTNIRTELGIITIDERNKIDFRKLDLFDKSEQDIIYKCIDYIKTSNNSLNKYLSKNINSDLILKLSDGATLFGHGKITKSTFRICAVDYKLACSNKVTGHVIYLNNIPTEEIRKNIFDFYSSKYLRYWIYKCCLAESQYKYIPFLGFDKYKTKWTESDYTDFFINNIGLSNKEWDFYKQESNKLPE